MFEKFKETLAKSEEAMAVQTIILALVVSIVLVVIGGYIMQSVWNASAINNTSIFYNGTVALPNQYAAIMGMAAVVFIVIFAAVIIGVLTGGLGGGAGGKRGK